MKIVDEALLASFRHGRCEFCKEPEGYRYFSVIEPHHIFSRGAGRLDIRCNLIALCRGCHNKAHSGVIKRPVLLGIVARREKMTVEEIEETVRDLRRQPK